MNHTSLAQYDVQEKIGQGGMGEVYRARDSKLGRDVALKFLPEPFASDPERLVRFQREARTLASLHHPNIATLFGLEEVEGKRFLVMELAQGENLALRIQRGAVPVEEAVATARQIALALEEAHAKGIVHRDLKPANVMLSPDGKVKVLDFGLAKAMAAEPEDAMGSRLLDSPTLGPSATRQGVILGTAAYMSPEQARGMIADHRADIWAFGVILYELLTGRQLFAGETVSDMLAGVLRDDLDLDAVPAETPPAVRRLLRRCLVRDPARRLQAIGDARLELDEAFSEPAVAAADTDMAAPPVPARRRALPWAVAAVFAGIAGAAWILTLQSSRTSPTPVVRAAILPPDGGAFQLNATAPGPPVVSPDGKAVVFAAREGDGKVSLYLRPLDAPSAFRLAGTDGAAYPFWSPDAASIGFFADGKLKKIPASGGPPLVLCEASNGKGGTWNRDGTIVFAPAHNTPLFRVSASGGQATPVTELEKDAGENSHRHPWFLPDGEHFLYLSRAAEAGAPNHILVGSLKGGEPRSVVDSPVAAEYAGGYLLHVRDQVLMASPFDLGTFTVGEGGVPVVDDVRIISSGAACAVFSASDRALVFQTGQIGGQARLTWYDRDGHDGGTLGEPGDLRNPRISPDGTQVAAQILDPARETTDLWIYDVEGGIKSRFTFGSGSETNPIWWPDGRSLLYSARGETTSVYRKPLTGTGTEELLLASPVNTVVTGVSPDGGYVLLSTDDPGAGWDVTLLPMAGDRRPVPFLATKANEAVLAVSPNGRWGTYSSDESGDWQCYVTPFPGGGRKWQISEENGLYSQWSRDGKAIRYIKWDGTLVEVEVDGQGDTFRVLRSHPLFQIATPEAEGEDFSFSPDGRKVLAVHDPTDVGGGSPLQLTTQWTQTLKR